VFQDQRVGEERYLLIGNEGGVIYLSGSSAKQFFDETGGIPSPINSPKMFPPSTATAVPASQ